MVRRLKEDLRIREGGFPERVIVRETLEDLPLDAPDLALPRLLDQYADALEARLEAVHAGDGQRLALKLMLGGLQQRLLSSPEAFAKTLQVHRHTLDKRKSRAANLAEAITSSEEPGEETEWDEGEVDSQISEVNLPDLQLEVALLDQMEGIAQSTRHRPDAKMRKLIDWIQQNLLHSSSTSNSTSHGNGKWKPVRVLIFSEYLDTVRYIDQQLRNAFAYDENFSDRLANFTGRTRPEIREEIKVAFNGDPERYPLRILLANDAAREGLNLQNHCYHVFHFDLPWNPSRLEQRNGRIDRKLQRSEKVYCHYFHYTQRDADKVLEALVRKTGIIQKQLGSLSRLLDGEIEATLKLGIRKNRITHLVDKLEATSLEETKKKAIEDELLCMQERQEELAGQLDRLRKQLADSQRAANFKEDPFRESLQCALRLLSAPPLHAFETMQGATAYHFPDLQTLDPSWVPAMDGLRPPRPRNIKPADWRREQKLRPIIFKDPGSLDDKAVHLHLEHRVVQRLLGRFTSQGFVYHDLARACIAQSEDALPRVVLLGRLSLYGKGSIRLHEELLAVSARWVEPEKRQEHKGMQPFGDEASRRALRLMEEGLLQPRPVKIPDMVQTRLRSGAMRDVSDLLPTLNEKAQAAALKAIDQLKQRGEAESKAMEKILDEQMQRIQKEFDGHDSSQVGLQTSLFNDDEKRQLEANMRHWQKRLHELENEVQSEPHRILEHYQILSQRIEPIGLAYLWPVTG